MTSMAVTARGTCSASPVAAPAMNDATMAIPHQMPVAMATESRSAMATKLLPMARMKSSPLMSPQKEKTCMCTGKHHLLVALLSIVIALCLEMSR